VRQALLTFGFGCCGCARAQKVLIVLQLAVATASLLGVGWLLWLMACTDYDDDVSLGGQSAAAYLRVRSLS